eukprot:UC1_evm1s1088
MSVIDGSTVLDMAAIPSDAAAAATAALATAAIIANDTSSTSLDSSASVTPLPGSTERRLSLLQELKDLSASVPSFLRDRDGGLVMFDSNDWIPSPERRHILNKSGGGATEKIEDGDKSSSNDHHGSDSKAAAAAAADLNKSWDEINMEDLVAESTTTTTTTKTKTTSILATVSSAGASGADSSETNVKETAASRPLSSPSVRIAARDMAVFGHFPMDDTLTLLRCPKCKKAIKIDLFAAHTDACIPPIESEIVSVKPPRPVEPPVVSLSAPQPPPPKPTRTSPGRATTPNSATTTSTTAALVVAKPEKAKSLPALIVSPNKKKAMNSSAKTKKTAGKNGKERELDLDRMCGVLGADGKTPCYRSLTCKSHAVKLKRLVTGRSASFDVLVPEAIRLKNGSLQVKKTKATATKRAALEAQAAEKKKRELLLAAESLAVNDFGARALSGGAGYTWPGSRARYLRASFSIFLGPPNEANNNNNDNNKSGNSQKHGLKNQSVTGTTTTTDASAAAATGGGGGGGGAAAINTEEGACRMKARAPPLFDRDALTGKLVPWTLGVPTIDCAQAPLEAFYPELGRDWLELAS